MDIGTGKDLDEYETESGSVDYHLINILEAGDEYNLFKFQCDFVTAFKKIRSSGNIPVLCGGTGMYLDSIARRYALAEVKPDKKFRDELEKLTLNELVARLEKLGDIHNSTDILDKERAIRAIEIKQGNSCSQIANDKFLQTIEPIVFLLMPHDRDILRARISKRLKERLREGLIEEVEDLLNRGIPSLRLEQYGLEYKFVTKHVNGQISFCELESQLETAIHQFASRQIRWFNRMERKGVKMHRLDSEVSLQENVDRILRLWKSI